MKDFDKHFGTEAQCIEAFARWRWPDGFRCPKCGHDKCYRLAHCGLRQCARCKRQSSATAGTPLNNTKFPLTKWFRGLYLVETRGAEVPVRVLMAQLSVSQNAAYRMRKNLVRLMNDRERPLRLALLVPEETA